MNTHRSPRNIVSFWRFLPGIIVSALLAVVGKYLQKITPNGVVSASVYALVIGMILHPLVRRYSIFTEGILFTGRKLLRFAIVGMGVTLHVTQVIQIGSFSLIVMLFTLATAFGGGYVLGRMLGMPWRQSSLISAGTGICGGSAIAAIAPVIDAKSQDITYALSATFIFDLLMVILFPLMGRALGMSDSGFGLWTGTAVNDTSSVVAAGYAFSETAGNFSIVVKLTRTLAIVPAVLIFSFIQLCSTRSSKGKQVSLRTVFPWFVLLFLGVVVLNSMGIIPVGTADGISSSGKFCMVMALGAIGLRTDAIHLARSGLKPMVHGFVISAMVIVVSYIVQKLLHQL